MRPTLHSHRQQQRQCIASPSAALPCPGLAAAQKATAHSELPLGPCSHNKHQQRPLTLLLPSLRRVTAVQKAKARGENPYPHKYNVSIQLPAYIEKYGGLEAGTHLEGEPVSIAGRITRKAASGAKLIFFDLRSEGCKLQVMCDAR